MLDVAIPMFTKLKWFGDSGSMVQFYQVRNKICTERGHMCFNLPDHVLKGSRGSAMCDVHATVRETRISPRNKCYGLCEDN